MSIRKKQDQESGVALILAIFGLLLLSAIALAMLFSSDTETSISVNYRDKQSAIYGALAGLQEARDRIHPLTGDLGAGTNLSAGGLNILPTALPSTSAPNVLYLINPASGETVAPWNPSNKYFDTELCHESYFVNNLGVTVSGRRNTLPGHLCLGPKRELLVRLVRQQPEENQHLSHRNRGCSHTRDRLPTQGFQRQQNSADL